MRTLSQAMKTAMFLTLTSLCALSAAADAPDSVSPTGGGPEAELQVEEVVVTARKREESLQRVPDAVTAFTASAIEQAGIEQVSDFAALTPNLTFQEGNAFRAGQFNLSMRGIGNGQEGWTSVSYIVDGVPAGSTDAINSGSLQDVERIEVLRGPQSALYGFNAIAGAINVITRSPTNEWEYQAGAAYGKGDDRELRGVLSGPLVPDKLLMRIAGSWREADGLIESASNGLDLDFKRHRQARVRLLFTPTSAVSLDLHAAVARERNGSTYQDKVPSAAFLDDFSSQYDARRGFAGADERELQRFAARLQWDFGRFALVSVTGYDDIDQHIRSSLCYDDPDDPMLPDANGNAQCLLGPAFGAAAPDGLPIDDFFDSLDNIRTFTEDIRIESRGNDTLAWTFGASFLRRTALAGFDAGWILAPDRAELTLFPAWNDKEDEWWGVYGQVSWRVNERLELTAAARYDDERYENTTYTDRSLTTVVPVFSKDGQLINTQREEAAAFQPKGQISYHFTDDLMGYVTVSRGFRAGYFNTGAFTLPEKTTNYELGLKSTFLERRVVLNTAVFHIDYSDQQFSTVIDQFPFRIAVTIPETRINGLEVESTILASRFLSFAVGLGYLDAEVSDGSRAPAAPRFNANASVDFTRPVFRNWSARLHVDGRHNTRQYLSTGNTEAVPAKTYLNLRAGLENDRYQIAAFVRNATDERQATHAGADAAGGYIRYQNSPRSYGIEVKASF